MPIEEGLGSHYREHKAQYFVRRKEVTLAHFHLAAVHLPIVAMPLLLLILLAGLWLKKQDLSNTALIGIVLIALVTIPIYLTGEAAEERVEHLPSISENQVEFHELAATIAFVMVH